MNKNDSTLRRIKVLSLVLLLAMSGNSATAAVMAVSNYTATNYTFTSLTIGENIYSDLTGSTANVVADAGDLIYWMQGTTPAYSGTGNANTVASGLSYREGIGNINVGSTFQFGRTITSLDFIFLTDYGTTEPVTFQLVNSSNTVLGTYSISITAAQFGTSDLIASTTYSTVFNSSGSGSDITGGQRAVAFQLADFVGTGDLSTATGIRLSAQGDGVDPSVVGLAAIPEPSSFLLLGLSGALLLLNRRQGPRFRLS